MIYEGHIFSECSQSAPQYLGPILNQLKGTLPLPVIAGLKQYDITALHNFINVADGMQSVAIGGTSSFNDKEVEVVSGRVKALKDKGMRGSQICVFAGYRKQVELLSNKATQAQWRDCFIGTIHKSPGQEFEIVIISLVKTEGHSGFIEELGRACVACSRHKIACYLVGNWEFWGSKRKQAYHVMSDIIKEVKTSSGPQKIMPELVVNAKVAGR